MIESRSLPSAVALEDVLARGREALAAGHIDGALRTFDAALRIKPTYAPAWRAKGRALRAAGDAQAALVCYAQALRHAPDDEDAWFGLALTLHALGRRAEEIEAYDEMIRANPRNVAAWMNRGVALHEDRRYKDALACCDRVLSLRPELAAAWNNRGAALLRLARFEDALTAFDEALALDPGFSDAATNRATALARLGRDAAAPPSLSIPPPTPLPEALQARVLTNLGLASLAAWRSSSPEAPDVLVSLGAALLDDGRPEAAVAAFRKAQASGGALAALGTLLALEVAGDSAGPEMDPILAAFPEVPRIAFAVARRREAIGDLAGAVSALHPLLERRPDLGWAWAWKGLLELRMERPSEACRSFERATQGDPEDAEAWSNLAAALSRLGRAEAALAACDRALSLDPASAPALNNRGVLLAALGRAKEGDTALRNAAKHGDAVTVALNRARLAGLRGQLRAALRFYDVAVRAEPTNPSTAAARRRLLGRLGARAREARAAFLARLTAIPGIGPASASRIASAGFDSPARIRDAKPETFRAAAKLTAAQARAVKRAFKP